MCQDDCGKWEDVKVEVEIEVEGEVRMREELMESRPFGIMDLGQGSNAAALS